ncbi:DeoR/GlpR family DNA-binding transcription regulator [Streptococcus hillyeri]|nr:DeoR/GlpR family DNA-binding transcription regulator [Streptococcus hillyeri]
MNSVNDCRGGAPILKSERKQLIMDRLSEEHFVTLEELVGLLETSESTVRRDLDQLESENKLRRVHGGAESLQTLRDEPSNLQKSVKNIQEKRQIVTRALEEIHPNDVIFIDAGTTTALLVDILTDTTVTVVTNSVHHASQLIDKGIRTIIIGGFVKQTTDASVGQATLAQINQLNFDKAFIGMNGVDSAYLTTPDYEEAMVKKAVIENAKECFVLVDSSKFGHISFVKVAEIEKVTLLTSESSSAIFQKIKEKTRVIEV